MRQTLLNIARFFYQLFFCHKKDTYQDGISVLVCAKNEEYTIKYSLLSVLPFADQIILIDNGSDDDTLNEMKRFKQAYENKIEIVLIEAPNMVLREARNIGLQHVDREWLMKSDSDFVFYTSGEYDAKVLLNKLTKTRFYKAFRLSFINLYGDLKHTYKNLGVYKTGEFYFLRMSKELEFVEIGKFDYLQIPRYYYKLKVLEPIFFHLDGLKSTDRLMYRNCYFEWRQTFNNEVNGNVKKELGKYDLFSSLWQKHLFNSENYLSIKYRFTRQFCELYLKKYNESEYYIYPEIVRDMIDKDSRFDVVYNEEKAFFRIDKKDTDMRTYEPTPEDKEWSIEEYNKKYHKKKYLIEIRNEVAALLQSNKTITN